MPGRTRTKSAASDKTMSGFEVGSLADIEGKAPTLTAVRLRTRRGRACHDSDGAYLPRDTSLLETGMTDLPLIRTA